VFWWTDRSHLVARGEPGFELIEIRLGETEMEPSCSAVWDLLKFGLAVPRKPEVASRVFPAEAGHLVFGVIW
jgi:hypothetical protein